MADAHLVQSSERLPGVGEQFVGDGLVAVIETRPDAFRHEQRIAALIDRCRDEWGHRRALPLGVQGQVGLMFDLLLPVDGDVATTGAVEDQSPELDEELAVPRVASVDLDVDVLSVGGACPCRGGSVANRHGRRRGVDADRAQRRGEVGERRCGIRRTEHQVHECAGSPADRQCAETLAGRHHAERQRRQPGEPDEPATEFPQWVDEVRIGHGDRRSAGGERKRRERHGVVSTPEAVEHV